MKKLLLIVAIVSLTELSAYTLNDMGQGTSPYYPQNRDNHSPRYGSSSFQNNNGGGYGAYSGQRQYNYNNPKPSRFNSGSYNKPYNNNDCRR